MKKDFTLNKPIEILSETACLYAFDTFEKSHYYYQLIDNCKRILNDVYRFKNFDQFVKDFYQEDINNRTEIYWNSVLYQYLLDHIKLSLVFENYNKLILLQKKYIVHIPEEDLNNKIYNDLRKGNPVSVDHFMEQSCIIKPDKDNIETRLKGFGDKSRTISYRSTLNNKYQKIIGLESKFVDELKSINEKRNILHFYIGPSSNHNADTEIDKWKYIMDTSYKLIESKFEELDF